MLGGVAHELESDGRTSRLCRRLVDGADGEVVDRCLECGVHLRAAVGRDADQPAWPNGGPRLLHGRVVLSDVDAVGVGRVDQVGAVVEDEKRVVRRRDRGEPLAGGDDLRVGGVLHPQLDEVDAGAEDATQELVGLVVADEV